jgi:hypothetical protein
MYTIIKEGFKGPNVMQPDLIIAGDAMKTGSYAGLWVTMLNKWRSDH